MRGSARWAVALVLGVVLASANGEPAIALDAAMYRATLAGIKGFGVLVIVDRRLREDGGPDSAEVVTDVELKLRQNGIRVLDPVGTSRAPGKTILAIKAMKTVETAEAYWYSMSVEVLQEVLLSRRPAVRTFAATWSVESEGIVEANRVGGIRDDIRDHLDKFLNAYLAANPKPAAGR